MVPISLGLNNTREWTQILNHSDNWNFISNGMISPGYPVEIVVNQAVFMVYHLAQMKLENLNIPARWRNARPKK